MGLNIRISLQGKDSTAKDAAALKPDVCVSEELSSVSKTKVPFKTGKKCLKLYLKYNIV